MTPLKDWKSQVENVALMLADRNCGEPEWLHSWHGDVYLLCSCAAPGEENWRVYFSEETKLGIKTLRNLKDECEQQKVHRAIVVNPDGLTPYALREEKTSASSGVALEIFKKSELAFNILRHRLVPTHTPLSAGEKAALLERLNCRASALPNIRVTDPVVRYLGCPTGTVFRITRCFGSLEQETYFRIVVA
jgi:DNA-directed RNA polymerase subunit H (RpoH/RPB5)